MPIPLHEKQIHILSCSLSEFNDSNILAELYGYLNDLEKRQQKKFHFERDRHRYTVTHGLTRFILTQYYSSISPQGWVFGTNKYGKPFVDNSNLTSAISFNFSYSSDRAVFAVSKYKDLGVDIEHIKDNVNITDIAKSFFTHHEFQEMLSLEEEFQKNRFFELWTLKEAYLKAKGIGLSGSLNQFYFHFSASNQDQINFVQSKNEAPSPWMSWLVGEEDKYQIAVCVRRKQENEEVKLVFYQIDPNLCFNRINTDIHATSKTS